MRLTRRSLLGSAAATFALLAAPRLRAQDAPAGAGRFVFVFAQGGWDPLCSFAPKFDSPLIQLSSTVGSEAWNSRDLKSRPH